MKLASCASQPQTNWHRLFQPAIEAASRAMNVWTQGRVSLSLDEVGEIPLEELGTSWGNSHDSATIVSLGVTGEVGGQFLFVLDDDGARRLAALLLNRASRSSAEWSEIERSALLETGNILGSAYLSALTHVTGVRLFPTPPEMLHDFLSCALQQAVMLQALESDTIMLARTCFRHGDERVAWDLFFVPSPELMHLLRRDAEDRT